VSARHGRGCHEVPVAVYCAVLEAPAGMHAVTVALAAAVPSHVLVAVCKGVLAEAVRHIPGKGALVCVAVSGREPPDALLPPICVLAFVHVTARPHAVPPAMPQPSLEGTVVACPVCPQERALPRALVPHVRA
jgi:hypothetical protein